MLINAYDASYPKAISFDCEQIGASYSSAMLPFADLNDKLDKNAAHLRPFLNCKVDYNMLIYLLNRVDMTHTFFHYFFIFVN